MSQENNIIYPGRTPDTLVGADGAPLNSSPKPQGMVQFPPIPIPTDMPNGIAVRWDGVSRMRLVIMPEQTVLMEITMHGWLESAMSVKSAKMFTAYIQTYIEALLTSSSEDTHETGQSTDDNPINSGNEA